VIAQADHRRIIVIMTATLRAAAIAGRLSRAGLIVARGLLTGLLLLHPRLFGAGLAYRARGAGLARLADLAGLLVSRRLGAGEAFRPCG
jgi:hypothetical protein